ncbi:bifunctional riboflavin kinase/FAD synthetase [bacterium]|nr:bifunctional riboflavin kinase/FAD synthetase [bacterium]
MKIYTELNNNHKNLSLALGFFDGIHLGHAKVIRNAVDYARKNGLKSAIVTFSSHPAQKFNKNFEGYIMPPEKRFEYFEKIGIDYCWVLDFETLVNTEAQIYIKNILVKNFAPKAITSGFNHNFGKNKKGTPSLLKEFSDVYCYEYFEIPPVIIDGKTVSSSAIREFMRAGDIENLNKFLGYNFVYTGEVVHGKNLGAKIGFRTANLIYPQDCVMFKFGVYGVEITVDKRKLKGIANFGVKPTMGGMGNQPLLEVHILDFDEDIYGKNVSVEFKNFIRDEKKFNSVLDLTEQIKSDIKNILN